jgi:hypothetical protein
MNARRRPRRRIEIYFILYLVALVFLLPKGGTEGTRSGAEVPSDIRLDMQPERVRLEARYGRDTSGMMIVQHLDSMNVIRYTGDVSDLTVRARIEDMSTGQILTIDPGEKTTSLFSLEPQYDRQAVVFRWKPDVHDVTPRTFRVTILGSGIPSTASGPNSADTDRLPAGLRISGSTQFVLSTSVSQESGSRLLAGRTIFDTLVIRQVAGGAGLGEFWVQPGRDSLVLAPGSEWVNRISFGGADPMRDLAGLPEVYVDRSEVSVDRYLDTAQQTLIVRGRALRSGSYSVTVRARRSDGKLAVGQFRVSSVPLPAPSLPAQIYPDVAYSIDPRLPEELRNAVAIVRIGEKQIAESRGGVIRFSVDRRDEGKTLTFERLVDGSPVGVAVPIAIVPFPPPEIRDVRDDGSGQRKKVIVLFYGDRQQNRPSLNVVEGNARPPRKLYGNIRKADVNDAAGTAWLEDFMIDRKDGSQPFEFKIQAVDGRGKRSSVWSAD